MIQSAQVPVFNRQGNEVGLQYENTINLNDGNVWHIVEGNVYAQPNDDFIGLIRGDVICGFTGEVLYTFGGRGWRTPSRKGFQGGDARNPATGRPGQQPDTPG